MDLFKTSLSKFLKSSKSKIKILDIGCGNDSVFYTIIGLPFEIVRRILGRNIVITWAFWGFEDVYINEHNKIIK